MATQVRYSKYEGPADDVALDELLEHLQEFLLESGFNNDPWDPDPEAGREFEDLLVAIAAALAAGELVAPDWISEAMDAAEWQETRLGQLVRRLAERLEEAGYVRFGNLAGEGTSADPQRFELTARAVSHLGNSALRQILGPGAGRLTGAHRTNRPGSGVEVSSGSRPYEYGDTLSLDAGETLRSAVRRAAPAGPVSIGHQDLHVQEGELHTNAATVLMLDCSHSMILYGEDRFTPGKKVALALAQLIRNQYRGDFLKFVLFHDSAEVVTLPQLAGMQVGPFHTNTAGGISLARRLLQRQSSANRQIIMITDGKPTAITLPGGRIYKNAYGQDALVLRETLAEVAACRRHGITINTFMLAHDPALLAFVRRMTEMTGGRSYLTSADQVGQFVLQEFSRRQRP